MKIQIFERNILEIQPPSFFLQVPVMDDEMRYR